MLQKLIQAVEGKKTYIAAGAMAVAVAILFFLGIADSGELAIGLTTAAAFCGLSSKLNKWLPQIVQIAQDAKAKSGKAAVADAIGIAAEAEGVKQ